MHTIYNTVMLFLFLGSFALAKKADYSTIISSDINTTIIEFKMNNFQLLPVQTDQGNMNLARFQGGASLLRHGAPDLYKFSR